MFFYKQKILFSWIAFWLPFFCCNKSLRSGVNSQDSRTNGGLWKSPAVVQVWPSTWPGGHLSSAFYRGTHGVSPWESTLHYKHRLDYVFPNRLTVSNHPRAPLNEGIFTLCLGCWIGKVEMHTHTETHADILRARSPGDWYTGLTGDQGGMRKKEKCLLNDIPIVRRSRTMALCKTANNEHGRNPWSYRGPGSMLAITIVI